jgi:DNA-binding response OmpR family regulator
MTEHEQEHTTVQQHVLVIEDDNAVAEMLLMLLEMEGYQASWVQTAPAALRKLLPASAWSTPDAASTCAAKEAEPRPDVVLLDLQLPGMSGEDLIAQLSDGAHAVPPIIVLSAKREQALEAAASMYGVTSVLPKPFPVDALLASISAALQV